MKKFPKIVQVDSRGQIVIPKDVRQELGIDEGTGFFMYTITNEGILLKKIDTPELSKQKKILEKLEEKSDATKIDKRNIKKSVKHYRKTKEGNLEII